MNIELHLRIAGGLQLALAAAHAPFPRWFRWREELARLSPLNRQIFIVHDLFVVLVLVLIGALSLLAAPALLEPVRLGLLVCAGLTAFWLVRLYCQFFVYKPDLWRGHPGRTAIHISITALWVYFVATYGAALLQHSIAMQ
jgi:hypothetical protein